MTLVVELVKQGQLWAHSDGQGSIFVIEVLYDATDDEYEAIICKNAPGQETIVYSAVAYVDDWEEEGWELLQP